MKYQVVFLISGARKHERPKEVEVVTLDAAKVDGSFWLHVIGILKRRTEVHSVVDEWMNISACDLSERRLGLILEVYESAKHPFTRIVQRCRCIYRNQA